MRIAFKETMRGTLKDEGGAEHPVDFEVVARSEGRGFFALTGVAHAAPWAPECPAVGSLVIAPLLRSIRYQVRLTAADGKALLLVGEKKPSALSPLGSMTLMPTHLEDDQGTVLARGTMHFDLADLPKFLSSWVAQPLLAATSKG